MGILNKLFRGSNKEEVRSFNWLLLNSIEQLDEIVAVSKEKPQAIFKHSTRCGISNNVIRRFENQTDNESIDFYYLDLLSFRDVSNEIASRFSVMHESPQLLLIKDGVVVAHASHGDILVVEL